MLALIASVNGVVVGKLSDETETELKVTGACILQQPVENAWRLEPLPLTFELVGYEIKDAETSFMKVNVPCITKVEEEGDHEICRMFRDFWGTT